jgi:hypothetical protein
MAHHQLTGSRQFLDCMIKVGTRPLISSIPCSSTPLDDINSSRAFRSAQSL